MLAPVGPSDVPRTCPVASRTTTLAVVDPTSAPATYRVIPPRAAGAPATRRTRQSGSSAAPRSSTEGRPGPTRPSAWGGPRLGAGRRRGAALASGQGVAEVRLPHGEAPAALHGVDDERVRLVLLQVPPQEVQSEAEVPVRVRVHRVLGDALERPRGVVEDPLVEKAADLRIRGGDAADPPPLEQLPERAEVGPWRRALDHDAELLLRDWAAPLVDPRPEVLEQEAVVLRAPLRPAQDVEGGHVEDRLEVRVAGRGVRLGGVEHLDPPPLRFHGLPKDASQPLAVERDPGDALAHRRQLLELRRDVVDVRLRGRTLAEVRDVKHEQLRAVEVGERLEPLHERVAPGEVAHEEVRLRELPERALAVREHEADVVLHVPAHVAGVPEVLRAQDVVPRDLLDPALKRVDLRIHGEHVEALRELDDVPRHEQVRDLAPVPALIAQAVIVLREELLLQRLPRVLRARRHRLRCGHHGLTQTGSTPRTSRPACARCRTWSSSPRTRQIGRA